MCGRYVYFDSPSLLKEYDLEPTEELQQAMTFRDNYNVSPHSDMPVIIRGSQAHRVEFMKWGLVPSWSKEPFTTRKLINARQEGLLEKPMWKRLMTSKRCIVPARGFYEWKKEGSSKQPYFIAPASGGVFNFAGLWDEWSDGAGNLLVTYTIITTSPNKKMSDIHDRMPAILSDEQMSLWLEPVTFSRDQLDELLAPTPDEFTAVEKVSKEVSNPRNNSKELIYPLG